MVLLVGRGVAGGNGEIGRREAGIAVVAYINRRGEGRKIGQHILIGKLGSLLFCGRNVGGFLLKGHFLGGCVEIAVDGIYKGQRNVDETLVGISVEIVIAVLRAVGLNALKTLGHKDIFAGRDDSAEVEFDLGALGFARVTVAMGLF